MGANIILVTGADGMIGTALIRSLLEKGYRVHALTRRTPKRAVEGSLHYFHWDVEQGTLDRGCLEGVDAIIHLAGEAIGGGRWTKRRKRQILDSRVKSIELLYHAFGSAKNPGQLKAVISASATGFYPDSGDRLLVEESPAAYGFLGETCVAWENAVTDGARKLGLRAVCLRSGVVLSKSGGMYAQLRPMVAAGLGVVTGRGDQWLPWIHEIDAINTYKYALENSAMEGVYNMVSPDQINLKTFMQHFAEGVGKRIWLPAVPSVLIRLALGQMSELLLASMRVSSSKLQRAGLRFRFERIEDAIADLEK